MMNRRYRKVTMPGHSEIIPWIGALAVVLTTVCWVPQAARVVRFKDTAAISLTTNLIFAAGILLWLIYGVAIDNWPLIVSNAISMVFILIIIAMKLRHG